jgi:hypothetical protein
MGPECGPQPREGKRCRLGRGHEHGDDVIADLPLGKPVAFAVARPAKRRDDVVPVVRLLAEPLDRRKQHVVDDLHTAPERAVPRHREGVWHPGQDHPDDEGGGDGVERRDDPVRLAHRDPIPEEHVDDRLVDDPAHLRPNVERLSGAGEPLQSLDRSVHRGTHPVHQSIDTLRSEHRLQDVPAPLPGGAVSEDSAAEQPAQRAPEHPLPNEVVGVVAQDTVHVLRVGHEIGPEQAQVEPDDLTARIVGDDLERAERISRQPGERMVNRDAARFSGACGIDVRRHGVDPLNPP